MSDSWLRSKRCIVKRLDFEDCVVTNIKTKTRRRKKLRAKTSREIHEKPINEDSVAHDAGRSRVEESPLSSSPDKTQSPIFTQKYSAPKIRPVQSSPKLSRKTQRESGSPIFTQRKKKRRKILEKSPLSKIIVPNESSPVFQFKNSPDLFLNTNNEKNSDFDVVIEETDNSSQTEDRVQARTRSEMRIDTPKSYSSEKISSELKISEATTETTNPSAGDSYKISEASDVKTSTTGESQEEVCVQNFGSEKKKKRYKKNSLPARLNKLIKRQISERRIWRHEKNIMKTITSQGTRLIVVFCWKHPTQVILKCSYHNNAQEQQDEKDSPVFLVVDRVLVPEINKAKEGSFLRIWPPWQSIHLEEYDANVLLSVVCLELEETVEDLPEYATKFQPLPYDESMFLRSLFSLKC